MTSRAEEPPFLRRYPKTRPALPPGIERIYRQHYQANRAGQSPASALSRAMEAWLHRQVASDVIGANAGKGTLELGAGTLNQLEYEPSVGPYDIVEPFTELFADSPQRARVRHVYRDIAEVPPQSRYERITSIATLEHVCDLPRVVARAALLLQPTGEFRAAIPSEGCTLWTLGWRLTTGVEFWLKHRLDYGHLMRHEHVNSAREIEDVLRYCFRRVQRRVFGLSAAFSLYQFFACSGVETDRCMSLADSSSVAPQ
jgi:hypothetical protein